MKVAFTGTRKGMTEQQVRYVTIILNAIAESSPTGCSEFHHGDAVGSDKAAGAIAAHEGFQVVPHPAGADPLVRDREMVDICGLLVACPAKREEELRSGTWYTIRYARKVGRPTLMVWP